MSGPDEPREPEGYGLDAIADLATGLAGEGIVLHVARMSRTAAPAASA